MTSALSTDTPSAPLPTIAFIGGGNMASAIVGGLVRQGTPPERILVVEPWAPAREALLRDHRIQALEHGGPALQRAQLVVWAVKPNAFAQAAEAARPFTENAVHLSVAAGVRVDSIAQWLATRRIVRAMPNTPALIARGVTALHACPEVTAAERQGVERVIAPTGEYLWVEDETLLDSVTALSGSGPAYVFFFLEAMTQAGADMGLPRAQAHQLAVATFTGASELARRSSEPPAVLRQRVTSEGGTTAAAIRSMEQDEVQQSFMRALHAARRRAQELGEKFQ